MTRPYGPLDLITLVSKLLAPLVGPLRAEFAACTVENTVQAPRVVEMSTHRPAGEKAGIPVESTVGQSSEIPASLPAPSEAGIPATAPLYVRVGAGRGARYRQASDLHPAGQRFRKRVANGRVKYELAR